MSGVTSSRLGSIRGTWAEWRWTRTRRMRIFVAAAAAGTSVQHFALPHPRSRCYYYCWDVCCVVVLWIRISRSRNSPKIFSLNKYHRNIQFQCYPFLKFFQDLQIAGGANNFCRKFTEIFVSNWPAPFGTVLVLQINKLYAHKSPNTAKKLSCCS
jgi:hypothetical protein